MPRILPTAQKIPEALYVHHMMAAEVMTIPRGVSMGMTMPSKLVAVRGSRQ